MGFDGFELLHYTTALNFLIDCSLASSFKALLHFYRSFSTSKVFLQGVLAFNKTVPDDDVVEHQNIWFWNQAKKVSFLMSASNLYMFTMYDTVTQLSREGYGMG